MKPFLPAINMKGAPTVFNDALDVAQQNLVEYIIGEELETQLERRDSEDAKLLKLCQRVIAVDAFLHSIPEMDLVLTDAGFGVISNQDVAPASKERIANLTAGLQAKLDEALDRLVVFRLVPEVIFILDPPYLSTDCGTYRSDNYWKLSDYLDVLKCLQGTRFVYFSSSKSTIV